MDKNDKKENQVGYKKPPRHSQFKPGQSGNPKGRPTATPKFADAFAKQLHKKVKVTMGNEVLNIPMFQAIAMKHVSLAASGNHKSTAIVMSSLQPLENDHSNHLPELLEQFRALHANHASERVGRPSPGSDVPQSDDVSQIEES